MNKELNSYIGLDTISLVEAMEKIDKNSKGLLYISDKEGRLVGCLSDGDIRRWIIRNGNIKCNAYEAMNTNPVYIMKDDREKASAVMLDHKVPSVAIINEDRIIVDVVFQKSLTENRKEINNGVLKSIPVIIMAGGKGTRLYPYTKVLPKPLIPIGEVPIIERIMDGFYEYGSEAFYVTVNYKKEMIKAYFGGINTSYSITYVDEECPLGTAGSLRLLKGKVFGDVIVTNCDILIDADYEDMFNYHKTICNDITIISSLKNVTIPYGVLNAGENGQVNSIEEKPQLSFLINTGMYIINSKCFELIPKERVYHMTDLVADAMGAGFKVGIYPISMSSFMDMGELHEMKKMEDQILNRKR